MPVNKGAIKIVESQQNILGKSILQIPFNSPDPIVGTDLGLKPISFRIDKRRLNYYLKIINQTFKGSSLLKTCV